MSLYSPIMQPPFKDVVVDRFEKAVLSKVLTPGDRLPPERELAERFGISRPVVHDALVDLEQKGVIEIRPRQGSFVKDFRTDGSIDLALSLLSHSSGSTLVSLIDDIFRVRLLFGSDSAFLAAKTPYKDCSRLLEIVGLEFIDNTYSSLELAEYDYAFHHQVALLSGNSLYPLLLNSFKPFLLRMLIRFYEYYRNNKIFQSEHEAVCRFIAHSQPEAAAEAMEKLLNKAVVLFEKIPQNEEAIENG